MPDEIKPDPKQASTQDAQLAAEDMATGKEPLQNVDLDKDYEASKQYSVSDVDRTGQGAAAAQAATQPEFKMSEPQGTSTAGATTGNPKDYMEMAKDVQPESEAATNVNDDLIKKALEKGQPGK